MNSPAKYRVMGVLIALGFPMIVMAHDYGGFLTASPSATDLHVVFCNNDGAGSPAYLFFEIKSESPSAASLITAQVQVPDRQIAESVTDPVNGDKQSSRIIQVPGGSSSYYVTVDKSGPGKISYSFTYHCETANGVHTGTDLVTFQDQ